MYRCRDAKMRRRRQSTSLVQEPEIRALYLGRWVDSMRSSNTFLLPARDRTNRLDVTLHYLSRIVVLIRRPWPANGNASSGPTRGSRLSCRAPAQIATWELGPFPGKQPSKRPSKRPSIQRNLSCCSIAAWKPPGTSSNVAPKLPLTLRSPGKAKGPEAYCSTTARASHPHSSTDNTTTAMSQDSVLVWPPYAAT